MALVENCCGKLSLRVGTIMTTWINLVLDIIGLVILLKFCYFPNDGSSKIERMGIFFMASVLIIESVFTIIAMCTVYVNRNMPNLMMPFIQTSFTIILISAVVTLFFLSTPGDYFKNPGANNGTSVTSLSTGKQISLAMLIPIGAIMLIVKAYATVVTFSYYQELCDSVDTKPANTSATAPPTECTTPSRQVTTPTIVGMHQQAYSPLYAAQVQPHHTGQILTYSPQPVVSTPYVTHISPVH